MSACPLCLADHTAPPVVCAGCAERAHRDLTDLPRLANLLLSLARGDAQSGCEPVSGSREPPLALRTDQWSFAGPAAPGDVHPVTWEDADCQVGDNPLPAVLASWVLLVAEERRVTVPVVQRRHYESAVGAYAEFLARHHDWHLQQPWADEYAREIHSLWKRARTLAADWPLVHRLPAPCPSVDCGLLTLRRDDGAAFIYCDRHDGGCGRRWSEADYQRLVLILVSEVGGRT